MEPYKKKVDINYENSEKITLQNINASRLVNELLKLFFDGKLVRLTDDNASMILQAIQREGKDRSIEDIVNATLEQIEVVLETRQKVILSVSSGPKVKPRIKRGKNFVTEF